jgi:transposase-like protein
MGKHCPEEFKVRVVKDYLEGARFIEVLRKYDVSKKQLRNWLKRYKETGRCENFCGKQSKGGRPRKVDPNSMTKDEYISFLEMENDILKQLSSLNSSSQR